jgi:thymidylate kinase
MGEKVVLDLVVRLCAALAEQGIDYCHWKSNPFLDRSANGDNDLDLLVSRAHVQDFTEVLYSLKFKEALTPAEDQLPGVRDYYGYDQSTGRLVHVHAHFQLILGNDLSKNYRLPFEQAYLGSCTQGDLFRVPAPEYELVVFVIRMVVKHSTWDSILIRHGDLSPSERHELVCLSTPDTLRKVDPVLKQFNAIDSGLFERCLRSLQPGCPFWTRVRAGEQLQKVLRPYARRPRWRDLLLKFSRRIWQPILIHGFRFAPKNRFASGGLFIAIVGGDGAGKTTMIDELYGWLGRKFEVRRLHMGKPAWSWVTIATRGILKIGTILHLYPFEGDVFEDSLKPHGTAWFVRSVCTARDRYRTYMHGRQASANGDLVLCDRYSFPGFLTTDGPQCERAVASSDRTNRLLEVLTRLESFYYRQIQLPDLLIVLKVNPDLAVKRKVDETEASVRARSAEVWDLDWSTMSACVVDASRSKADTLSHVRDLVWAHL